MEYDFCMCCDCCDTSKTNDKNQAFCTKFSTYVDIFNRCDDYSDKKYGEVFVKIFEGLEQWKEN